MQGCPRSRRKRKYPALCTAGLPIPCPPLGPRTHDRPATLLQQKSSRDGPDFQTAAGYQANVWYPSLGSVGYLIGRIFGKIKLLHYISFTAKKKIKIKRSNIRLHCYFLKSLKYVIWRSQENKKWFHWNAVEKIETNENLSEKQLFPEKQQDWRYCFR